jgi:hypothetical protein
VDLVPDRIADLLRVARKFRLVRNELARDGIGRIGAVDEFGHVGGQRERIARGNGFDPSAAFSRDRSGRNEIIGSA